MARELFSNYLDYLKGKDYSASMTTETPANTESTESICAEIRETLAQLRAGRGMVPAWMNAEECIAELDKQLDRLTAAQAR